MRLPVLLSVVLMALNANAQDDGEIGRAPRYTIRTQFAGMQGLISGGMLWNLPDGRLRLGAMYGYDPGRYGGTDLHAAILRANGSWFPIHQTRIGKWSVSPIASLSAMLELGGITFLTLPDQYPAGFYSPQSIHGLLGLGIGAGRINSEGGWLLTAEAVSLDTYLWYGLSQRQVKFTQLWNLALGVEYYF